MILRQTEPLRFIEFRYHSPFSFLQTLKGSSQTVDHGTAFIVLRKPSAQP